MDYHLLLIREDIRTSRYVADALKGRGYAVATVSTLEFSSDPGLADTFDLIIIDHSEPRLNAMEICSELRQRHIEVPLVVLAHRAQVPHRVEIFNAGADDYLIKPIDPEDLGARIEALLIRAGKTKKPEIVSHKFGKWRVDFRRLALTRDGSRVELSEREIRLLQYFVENRGKTISRNALLRHVWGYQEAPLTRTVDVHVLRLRNKIEENPREPRFIVTVPGFGYRFDG
jgi:two-component system alkaline phosphatase synthesis response regulator PhoP